MLGAAHCGDDVACGLRPLKGFCTVLIVNFDESLQFGLQLRHAGEHTTVQGTTFQLSKPTFDSIQPRRTGGREVKVDAGVRFKPLAHSRCFVSAEIVQDDV